MWRADDRRFIFVTGKGGVGKTTVSAALARALAGRGKRVLIAMCNAKERISSMFASELVGPDIIAVAPGIWAVNIEPEHAFEEYGRMVLKVPGLYRVVFHNKYIRSFLPAVPGLSEWAMLGKAWFHTTEVDENGRRRFDVVLLDAPATGHGLDMLRVPKVIVEIVPPGILRRDAERAWKMFADPAQTAVLVVTLPEELPATETLELIGAVRDDLRLPLGALVVNGVLPVLFSEAEARELAKTLEGDTEIGAPADLPAAASGVRAAARRAVQERAQAASQERLASGTDLPRIQLPYLFEDAATPAAIERLSSQF
ncbi:MAG TPA: ArsA family ATPase [Polyangiaceae bacterium]|nr:ArsA family ATPase [Polyangiaceae bacterium]